MNRVRVLTRYLETYLDAEEPFACSASFEDAVMLLRSRYKGDAAAVVQYAHAHSRLARRSGLVLKILDEVSAMMNGAGRFSFEHLLVVFCCGMICSMMLLGIAYKFVVKSGRGSVASEDTEFNRLDTHEPFVE